MIRRIATVLALVVALNVLAQVGPVHAAPVAAAAARDHYPAPGCDLWHDGSTCLYDADGYVAHMGNLYDGWDGPSGCVVLPADLHRRINSVWKPGTGDLTPDGVTSSITFYSRTSCAGSSALVTIAAGPSNRSIPGTSAYRNAAVAFSYGP